MIKKLSPIIVLLSCQNVYAEKSFDGVYIFTSAGQTDFSDMTTQSDINQTESRLLTSLLNQFAIDNPDTELPQYTVDLSAQETSTSLAFGMGYIFSEHIAVEASYQYLGAVKISGQVSDSDNNSANYTATGLTSGFDLRTVLRAPIYKGFEAFINWGAILWSRETRTNYEFANESRKTISKEDGMEVVFGAGMQYLAAKSFGASLRWEQYNINRENVDVIKATLLYDFDIPQ